MKKISVLLLSITIGASMFVGCGKKAEETKKDTTVTKVETTVTSDDAKKAEDAKKLEEEAKKAEETKKVEEAKQAAATTTTVAKTSSSTAKSSGSSSATTTKPSTPTTPTQPTTPTKQSGIDWGITNNIRSSKIACRYNGIQRPNFDQMLLDVVNGNKSSSSVTSTIKQMSWQEECYDGTFSGKVKYTIGSASLPAYKTKSSDPQMITSRAVSAGVMPTGDYRNFIVYYDANTQNYTLYILSVKFQYEQ